MEKNARAERGACARCGNESKLFPFLMKSTTFGPETKHRVMICRGCHPGQTVSCGRCGKDSMILYPVHLSDGKLQLEWHLCANCVEQIRIAGQSL
jgi:hypothetical protein